MGKPKRPQKIEIMNTKQVPVQFTIVNRYKKGVYSDGSNDNDIVWTPVTNALTLQPNQKAIIIRPAWEDLNSLRMRVAWETGNSETSPIMEVFRVIFWELSRNVSYKLVNIIIATPDGVKFSVADDVWLEHSGTIEKPH
jgi:hypothetical protein